MLKAPGLGFPRFLKKFEFCVTNFSLEFSNPRSRQSISIGFSKRIKSIERIFCKSKVISIVTSFRSQFKTCKTKWF